MVFFNPEKKSKVLLSQEMGGDEQPGAEASRSVVLVGSAVGLLWPQGAWSLLERGLEGLRVSGVIAAQ